MKIFRDLQEINLSEKPLTVVLGNFDGVHLGHQKLIKMAQNNSQNIDGETLVFTFYPHPQKVLNKKIGLLNPLELKIELIAQLGVDYFLAVPFNEQFYKLSPEEFVYKILYQKLKVTHVIAGFNYSFGFKGKGKAQDLVLLNKNLGIKTTIMQPFYINNELVSSSKIRQYLKNGQIVKASKLLGYFPKIKGKIIEGNKLGRELGFPTANIKWDPELLIPNFGVYIVKAKVRDKINPGVLNIGIKPTVSNEKTITMEVNILDFKEDIYNEEIEVIFYKKLRDEKKFTTISELKNQIRIDALKTRDYFTSQKSYEHIN